MRQSNRAPPFNTSFCTGELKRLGGSHAHPHAKQMEEPHVRGDIRNNI